MKTPVDEAPAGPAMDAAVAEALGHLVFHHSDFVGEWFIASDENAFHQGLESGFFWECGGSEPRKYCWELPKYSTDIAAAWELMEVKRFHIGQLPIDWDNQGWYCADSHDFNDAFTITVAEAAPLAICRAFLKANEYVETAEDG